MFLEFNNSQLLLRQPRSTGVTDTGIADYITNYVKTSIAASLESRSDRPGFKV